MPRTAKTSNGRFLKCQRCQLIGLLVGLMLRRTDELGYELGKQAAVVMRNRYRVGTAGQSSSGTRGCDWRGVDVRE